MASTDMIKPLHGLRGLAALVIVLNHFAPVQFRGALALVLFFVMSGFLMGKLYLVRDFNGRELWLYASARFARIYPLFALVILAAGLSNAFLGSDVFELKSWQIDRHLILLGDNITIWTIAVESHFYIMFVLFWLAFARGWLNPWALAALYLVFALGPFLTYERIHPAVYLHIFTMGMLVAKLTQTTSETIRKVSSIVLPISGVMFVAFSILFYVYEIKAYQSPVGVLLCAVMVYTAVQGAESAAGRFLSLPPLYWLGEISFGVYLWHRFVGEFVLWMLDAKQLSWTVFALTTAITIVFASIVFKIYEDPMRRLIRNLSVAALKRVSGDANSEQRG